jgi:hypothetical protein
MEVRTVFLSSSETTLIEAFFLRTGVEAGVTIGSQAKLTISSGRTSCSSLMSKVWKNLVEAIPGLMYVVPGRFEKGRQSSKGILQV